MFKDLYFISKYLRDFISRNELIAAYEQLSTDFNSSKSATEADIDTIESRIKEIKDKIYTLMRM
jgi:archaellum component FlaC